MFGKQPTNTRAPLQSIAGSGRNLDVADQGYEDGLAKEMTLVTENLMREIAGEAGAPEAGASGDDLGESERSRAIKAA